jgi:drug/metabolite transporter (DMT)-like permease
VLPINRTMTLGEWGILVGLATIWGGSYLFNAIAVRELPPITVAIVRLGLAALILHAVLRLRGVSLPREPRVWLAFLGMGVLNNAVPITLIAWGQTEIAAGVASILNAMTPLFGVVVAHLLTADEKLTPSRALGVVLGVLGVAVLVGLDAARTLGAEVAAQAACLAAALSYAFAGVFGRRFRGLGVTPMQTATGQLTAASLVLLPFWLIVDMPWTLPMPSASAVGALLGLATLSTAFGYVLFFRLLATAGATNLMLVTLLIPVSAVFLGAVVLGEVLLPQHLAGMALIGAGLAAIDGRVLRLRRHVVRERADGRSTP